MQKNKIKNKTVSKIINLQIIKFVRKIGWIGEDTPAQPD